MHGGRGDRGGVTAGCVFEPALEEPKTQQEARSRLHGRLLRYDALWPLQCPSPSSCPRRPVDCWGC